jgi:uncharacterized membrane-anchored protein YhcB (DUF1043 family)
MKACACKKFGFDSLLLLDLDRMLEHETAELQELDDELDKVREEYDHAKEELEQLRAGARSERSASFLNNFYYKSINYIFSL